MKYYTSFFDFCKFPYPKNRHSASKILGKKKPHVAYMEQNA